MNLWFNHVLFVGCTVLLWVHFILIGFKNTWLNIRIQTCMLVFSFKNNHAQLFSSSSTIFISSDLPFFFKHLSKMISNPPLTFSYAKHRYTHSHFRTRTVTTQFCSSAQWGGAVHVYARFTTHSSVWPPPLDCAVEISGANLLRTN